MNLFFLSPEVWPFARVGGLAEVSHDLPRTLAARGHRVQVVTLKGRMAPEVAETLEPTGITLEVPISWHKYQAQVFKGDLGAGAEVYLIQHDRLYDREGIYGNAFGDYEDNCERFVFFSRACLELAAALGRPVDMVHANDWTNALVPVYLKTLYAEVEPLAGAASLMTVHNLARQGSFWHYDMPLLGLGWECFTPETLELYGKINFLKGGLIFADLISTVSPSYAREMLLPEIGAELQGVLQARRDRLVAVLNGIDNAVWDPATDPHLAAHFSAEDLAGKAVCQRDLREIFGLARDSRRPLVAVIGRLEDRKGLELIVAGLEDMVAMGLDLVIMGYGGDHYHNVLKAAAEANPGRAAVRIGHDMALDHKIMAGADLLLMPSRFEPCGLHQMHAMRYGTVPVVRATGGLNDTVRDHLPDSPGMGFKFQDFTTPAMLEALDRALETFGQGEQWQGLIKRCMWVDFSWQGAAARYEELYQRAIELRRGPGGEGLLCR